MSAWRRVNMYTPSIMLTSIIVIQPEDWLGRRGGRVGLRGCIWRSCLVGRGEGR